MGSRTFVIHILLAAGVLLAVSGNVTADSTRIARCVDEKGDLTYSDFYCITYENANPLLMTEQYIDQPVRSNHSRSIQQVDAKFNSNMKKINEGNITSLRLQSVTNDAISRCNKRFTGFFKRQHPHISQIPAVEFSQIKDQFLQGSTVSISVAATVEYADRSSPASAYIECTVQKFSGNKQWMVGFLER